jgi:hypothetical protein
MKPAVSGDLEARAIGATSRQRRLCLVQRFGKAVGEQARRNDHACDGPHPRPILRRTAAAEYPADGAFAVEHIPISGAVVARAAKLHRSIQVAVCASIAAMARKAKPPTNQASSRQTTERGNAALRRCSRVRAFRPAQCMVSPRRKRTGSLFSSAWASVPRQGKRASVLPSESSNLTPLPCCIHVAWSRRACLATIVIAWFSLATRAT